MVPPPEKPKQGLPNLTRLPACTDWVHWARSYKLTRNLVPELITFFIHTQTHFTTYPMNITQGLSHTTSMTCGQCLAAQEFAAISIGHP